MNQSSSISGLFIRLFEPNKLALYNARCRRHLKGESARASEAHIEELFKCVEEYLHQSSKPRGNLNMISVKRDYGRLMLFKVL